MKRIYLFSFALCLWVNFVLPEVVLGSAEFGAGAEDPNCMGAAPQNANFATIPFAYVFTGVCDLAITRLNLPVKVVWTGVGRYNPGNGQTAEDIIVPAPRLDEPSRPYGRFTATMHCKTDPWLNPSVTCDNIAPTVNAPLDNSAPNAQGWRQPFPLGPSILQAIYDNKRPFTSIMRQDAVNALNAQYQTYLASLAAQRQAELAKRRFSQSAGGMQTSFVFAPQILAPTAGQRFYAQSPVSIKLAPPQGWSVNSYLVSIQKKNAKGGWDTQTNIPVSAAEAQSAQGYTGFGTGGNGPAKSAAYLTGPGTWRLAAQASSPRQSGWTDPVEFTVIPPLPVVRQKAFK